MAGEKDRPSEKGGDQKPPQRPQPEPEVRVDQGIPEQGGPEPTISLTRSQFNELVQASVAAALQASRAQSQDIGVEAEQAFFQSLTTKSPEDRERALVAYLTNLSPEARARREQAIRDAYASLGPAPVSGNGREPGQYVAEGRDTGQAPILRKVRWRREDLEREYLTVDLFVTVVPRGGVTIHGVEYPLKAGLNKVPSIVAEQYQWWLGTQQRIENQYPPLTLQEEDDMRQKIARGANQVFTRVHQVGIGILTPETFPAATAQE